MSESIYSMLEKVLSNQLHINARLDKIADALEGAKELYRIGQITYETSGNSVSDIAEKIARSAQITKLCRTCRRGKVEGEPPRDLTADTLLCADCGDGEYSQWTPKLDKPDKSTGMLENDSHKKANEKVAATNKAREESL